jgi:hypothetical protein
MDLAHSDRVERAFANLLGELDRRWPRQDVDYVREEVGHGEYGDALENLIALGLRNGKGFDPSHVKQIETLAASMEMGNSPLLMQLRSTTRAGS